MRLHQLGHDLVLLGQLLFEVRDPPLLDVFRPPVAGWPLERCARLANAAGALATTAVGAFEGVGDLSQTLRLAELEDR